MGGEERTLVQSFLNIRHSRPEGLYGPLLIRLLAAFERFVRGLIVWTVDHHYNTVAKFDDLSAGIAQRNRQLTGKMLALSELPDHLVFDIPLLIGNLATCKAGYTGAFRLNSVVFSSGIAGFSPKHLETALENIDVEDFWDFLGRDEKLIAILGTKGARQTGKEASERLKELSRLRNRLAHGGDGAPLVSEVQLRDAQAFIAALSKALEDLVLTKLKIA